MPPAINLDRKESYKEKWVRLQEENPGVFCMKWNLLGRVILVGCLVSFIKVFEKTLPHIRMGECIRDLQHTKTQSMNNYLRENPTLLQFCQGMYTGVFDLTVILFSFYWYKKGRSMRYIVALWMFYLFKIIMDASIWFTAPDYMLWEPSVMPSLFIKSDATYHFSCAFIPGIYMIIACECKKIASLRGLWLFVTFLSAFSTCYAIVSQINWTSDLCSSIVIGIFCSIAADFLCFFWVDRYLAVKYDWAEWNGEKPEA